MIFGLVSSVTALSVYAIEQGEHQRDRARLGETAQAISSALERRGTTSSAYLRAGAALFASAENIDDRLLRRFATELNTEAEDRGSDGIGWAEAVRPADVPAYIARAQTGPDQTKRIFPSPDASQPLIVPVTSLEPDTVRNRRAIGYNMFSEPTRRAAMIEAARSMRPTATGKIILLQDGDQSQPGFLIYMPVFGNTRDNRELKGFIYSPFNAQTFLDSALKLEPRLGNGVQLYDGDVAQDNLIGQVAALTNSTETVTQRVMIANRPMVLRLQSPNDGSLSDLSMATMIFGLLVASLLMIVARLLTQQAIEDRASLQWLREQNSIRDSLTRELNHRVKNTLANVLSIISLTRRRASSLNEFADGIDGRIRALSATHDLLTQSEWGTTPVRAVIAAELAPYERGADRVVMIDGPDVELAPNDALSLGLAIHELATNAAKFGSLSEPGGEVSVAWRLVGEQAQITWQESNGPPVPSDRSRGFGLDLIEKIVAHELRNPVDLEFAEQGVRCVITIPIRKPSEFAMRAKG